MGVCSGVVFAVALSLLLLGHTNGGSFTIDYEHDTFLKDGEPFRCLVITNSYVANANYTDDSMGYSINKGYPPMDDKYLGSDPRTDRKLPGPP